MRHALGMAHRIGDRDGAALGDAEQGEALEAGGSTTASRSRTKASNEIRRRPSPTGRCRGRRSGSACGRATARDRDAPDRALEIEFEMGHPVARLDQRRPAADAANRRAARRRRACRSESPARHRGSALPARLRPAASGMQPRLGQRRDVAARRGRTRRPRGRCSSPSARPDRRRRARACPGSGRWRAREMHSPPGSHSASSRAATLTPSPKMSSPSMMMSPTLMPMRKTMRLSSATPRCGRSCRAGWRPRTRPHRRRWRTRPACRRPWS